jgi:hypothetical protein
VFGCPQFVGVSSTALSLCVASNNQLMTKSPFTDAEWPKSFIYHELDKRVLLANLKSNYSNDVAIFYFFALLEGR